MFCAEHFYPDGWLFGIEFAPATPVLTELVLDKVRSVQMVLVATL
jgi:hypothetical protein